MGKSPVIRKNSTQKLLKMVLEPRIEKAVLLDCDGCTRYSAELYLQQ